MSKTQTNISNPVKVVLFSTAFITISVALLNIILAGLGVGELINESTNQSLYILGLFIIQEAILIAPVLYYLKKKNIDLGFKKQSIKKIILYVLAGFFGFILINGIIQYVSLTYNIQIPGYGDQAARVTLFGDDPYSMIIAAFVLVILAPLVEELLFRGLIFNQLRQRYSSWATIVISAAIFAGFHLEFQVFIPLFILGLIIGKIYDKTGTIWTPIAFHMFNNLLAYIEEVYSISQAIS